MLRKTCRNKLSYRGAALITALLFVVLSVSISTILYMIMQVELGFADLMISGDRVQNSLKYVETEAIALLNKRNFKNNTENNNKELNQSFISNYSFKSQIIDYVKVSGELEIQSGKFNINYLYDQDFCNKSSNQELDNTNPTSEGKSTKKAIIKEIFTNILMSLDSSNSSSDFEAITPETAEKIINNIQAWMCPYDSTRGENMKGPYIKSKNDKNVQWPYRSSAQKLVVISELKLIKGISNGLYQALKEAVAVWPTSTGIDNVKFDVRFISPFVLAAILGDDVNSAKNKLDTLSENRTVSDKKKAILKIIEEKGIYKDKPEKLQIINGLLGTENKLHYILYSEAIQGRFNITAYTMLSFTNNANVEWRIFGVF